MPEGKNLVCIAVISAAHGIKGLVKIKSFTENPQSIFDYDKLTDESGHVVQLHPCGESAGMLLAQIDQVTDRNAAEALKGTKLYIPRDALPTTKEGEFYIEDLIGLKVKIADGRTVGTVKHVANYGAGDVVEIAFNNGTEELYSFTQENFPQVDMEEGFLRLEAPEILE